MASCDGTSNVCQALGNGALAGVVAGQTATFYVQGYDALSPKNSAPLPADESIVVTFEELDAGGSAVVSLVGVPIAINENELVGRFQAGGLLRTNHNSPFVYSALRYEYSP